METRASLIAGVVLTLGLVACDPATPELQANEKPANGEARLFAPDQLGQAGRVTLSPGFSPDGDTIYFAQADCERIWECPQLLMRSERTPDGWSKPERVPLPQEARVDWPSVSPDGKTLFFSWAPKRPDDAANEVYENFDLYRLDLSRSGAVPERLRGPDINRIRGGKIAKLRFVNNETAPVLTEDGELYFWSERLDGVGLRDIYRARSDGEGGFLAPEALPAPINDAGENASWVSNDGKLMLTSKVAQGSAEPSDLYVAVKRGKVWSAPRKLGSVVNSPYAEFAARVTPDQKTLVFTSDRPARGDAAGLLQVWAVPVSALPVLQEALAEISG